MTRPDLPTVIPEVAFATAPADPSPTWVNVAADFRSGSTTRGRQQELDRYQAGRMDMVLNNRGRKYDPEYAAGTHSPNVKPMRRTRLRATWNSVTYPIFDGYADKWDQEYDPPREATATLQATDGFKVLTKSALLRSVYAVEVSIDGPVLWWPLGDPSGSTANDASGNGRHGTLTGSVTFGASGLIVRDADSAAQFTETAVSYIDGPLTLDQSTPFAFELWFSLNANPTFIPMLFVGRQGGVDWGNANFVAAQINNVTRLLTIIVGNSVGTYYQLNFPVALDALRTYHLVITHDSDRVLRGYIDGVLAVTGDTTAGTFQVTNVALGSPGSQAAPNAVLDEFAVYTGGGTTALSTTRIAAHNAAGRTPWAGDLPGARLTRILDLARWPAGLRDLDTGSSTLQSATLNQTALEHAQKVADSDFGQLFMTADGKVRFNGRSGLLNRVSAGTFGDGPGELPYAAIGFDNGDQLIRNPVTVSRTDGVPQTSSDAAGITEYLDHQYDVSGLLHDSDQLSKDAADFLVSEYKEPKSRVTTMVVAPQRSPTALWPVVLGAELGDVFTVIRRPQGIGAAISQDCEIQGIKHDIRPGEWTVTFTLSPAYTGATSTVPAGQFFQLDLTSGPGLDSLRLYF